MTVQNGFEPLPLLTARYGGWLLCQVNPGEPVQQGFCGLLKI